MIKKIDSNKARLKRHRRVRAKISGTPERPRLNVFRSTKHIYAQIIDDVNGVTLAAASSMDKGFEGNGGNVEGARKVGEMIAKNAQAKGISEVVFDRILLTSLNMSRSTAFRKSEGTCRRRS
ncbi:50S ribosomal protein L18 [Ruminococcus sp. CAG:624]|nr:50S ribosomal protein L18 [Ruminococcus sp. CAG:624]